MSLHPEMSGWNPDDPGTAAGPFNPPSGPLSGQEILMLAALALAAWLALLGAVWLLWEVVA